MEQIVADTSYLLFKIDNALYGIGTDFVYEIVELPELQSTSEMPSYLIGLFDLHGNIVQVIDLGVCLGHPSSHTYSVEDLVIVLKGSNFFFGFIVSSIMNIAPLSQIHSLHLDIAQEKKLSSFFSHVANHEEQMAFILDPNLVVRKIEDFSDSFSARRETFQPKAEDRMIFSVRASKLKQPIAEIKPEESLTPLAVIAIEEETFGINPEVIKEFFPLESFTPIPNAPPHLVGFMNFRGTVLTLIDLWSILKNQKITIKPQSCVLVIEVEQLVMGVVIDEMIDLIYLHPSDFQLMPVGLEGTLLEKFTKHTVLYEKDFLSVLDIVKILESIIGMSS